MNFEIASLKKKEKRERNIYTRDKKLFYHLDPCITRFHPVYNQCVLDRKITKKKRKKVEENEDINVHEKIVQFNSKFNIRNLELKLTYITHVATFRKKKEKKKERRMKKKYIRVEITVEMIRETAT